MDNIETLLNEIEPIRNLIEAQKEDRHYNVLTSLYKSHDEVRLHSRFLKSLIDRYSNPKLRISFLKELLEILNLAQFSDQDFQVYNEYLGIDILLKSSDVAIIIENKIYAGDQHLQLLRYYNKMLEEGYQDQQIHIFYLTLDGHEPAENSIIDVTGDSDLPVKELKKEKINLISYSLEIRKWINECLKSAVLNPSIREVLSQYQQVMNSLTSSDMDSKENELIYDFLIERDNMLNAAKIANNWISIKQRTEFEFWSDLEKAMIQRGKTVLPTQKWNKDQVIKANESKRDSDRWYGLMYEAKRFKTEGKENVTLAIFIERSPGPMLYGVTPIINGSRDTKKLEPNLLAALRTELSKTLNDVQNNGWIALGEVSPLLNFDSFSNNETLRLCKTDYRSQTVSKIMESMESFEIVIEKVLS